jgi:hypothetical protein
VVLILTQHHISILSTAPCGFGCGAAKRSIVYTWTVFRIVSGASGIRLFVDKSGVHTIKIEYLGRWESLLAI